MEAIPPWLINAKTQLINFASFDYFILVINPKYEKTSILKINDNISEDNNTHNIKVTT